MRERDPALPIAAEDAAFEAARATARRALIAERAAAGNVEGGLAVRPLPAGAFPDHSDIKQRIGHPDPGYQNGEWVDGNHLQVAVPRVVARRVANHERLNLVFENDAGELQPIVTEDDAKLGRIAVRADGSRGIANAGNAVYEIDFGTGRARALWRAEAPVQAVGALGDRWVVRTPTALVVLDPTTDDVSVAATAKRKAATSAAVFTARDGTIIFANDRDKTAIYGYCETKLEKLDERKLNLLDVHERGPDVLLRTYADGEFQAFAVDGLDAVYEAWAAPIRAKAAKRRAAAAKAPPKAGKPGKPKAGRAKLALAPADAMPPEPSWPVDDDAKTALDAYRAQTRNGVTIGLFLDNSGSVARYWAGYRRNGENTVFDGETLSALTAPKQFGGWFAPSDDGAQAIFFGDVTHVIVDTETGALSSYTTPNGTIGRAVQAVFVTPQTVVIRYEPEGWDRKKRGIRVEVARQDEKGWTGSEPIEVPKLVGVAARGDIVAVLSGATSRMVVFAHDAGGIVKLGAFKERITSARFDDTGRLFVSTVEGDAFEVTGLAEVAAKKLAAAAKRR